MAELPTGIGQQEGRIERRDERLERKTEVEKVESRAKGADLEDGVHLESTHQAERGVFFLAEISV